ncbi:hypothetical protein AVEN_159111-1 [Araneus ventricosus]|uniref:Uncharacterized protein n=1 Tax=Araneus ventricosus TaxID=182803 RepID=A0A4Y2B9S3_ARAVE|nr:hypothetical protein AVEN_159111-1 [Araneus ventricosus]
MFPKKKPQKDNHKRRKITVEMKLKTTEKRERGVNVTDLARIRTYYRSTSMICTIPKSKDMIEEIYASKVVRKICTQRLRVLDDVERFLPM